MDLYEYQGKRYFARFGIPVGQGAVADTVDEAVAAAETVGYPATIKAQVKVGGRGKAGGVKVVADRSAAEQAARRILGLDIKGHMVRRLWVEEASQIAREYYASFTLDRADETPPRHRLGEGGHRHRTGRRGGPRGDRTAGGQSARRARSERRARPSSSAPASTPGRRRASSTRSCGSTAATSRATADLVEINPLVLTT